MKKWYTEVDNINRMEKNEMKFISWNVNGIRACVQKGFLEFFHEIDADIFCIQESKLQEGQIELNLPGYYQYWNYAKGRGIPELPFLRNRNPCLYLMESESKNMTRKAA